MTSCSEDVADEMITLTEVLSVRAGCMLSWVGVTQGVEARDGRSGIRLSEII